MTEGPLPEAEAVSAEELLVRAGRLGAATRLASITFNEISAKVEDYSVQSPYTVATTTNLDWHRPTDSPETLAVLLTYQIRVSGEEDREACSIELGLAVVYELPAEFEVSDADIKAFATVSVLFTAYPYIRELTHSLSLRLGFPPLVLEAIKAPFDPSSMAARRVQEPPST